VLFYHPPQPLPLLQHPPLARLQLAYVCCLKSDDADADDDADDDANDDADDDADDAAGG
jgi:hypothetical protein